MNRAKRKTKRERKSEEAYIKALREEYRRLVTSYGESGAKDVESGAAVEYLHKHSDFFS